MTKSIPSQSCPTCQQPVDADTRFCGRCGSSLRSLAAASVEPVPEDRDVWIGRLIDGRYRVMSRLGHGGMGIVYKVEHQRMGKIAAMKVLHRELAGDHEVVRRFRREAEAVSKLTHPNTVQTFDFGTVDGAMYLVMEYVRGEDLGTIVRRDGPLPFTRVAHVLIQVCGALAEAHELGIVHRDLKPENILVTRTKDGRDHAKVLDFGLAKLSEREELADVTGRGAVVGTPYYMSPEQVRGESLDHRSDVYSLGALMYRVLTGEHPFVAQTPVGVLTKHLTDPLVPPRERCPALGIDERVDAIVVRAMAKQREDRYPTVDSLREDLERVLRAIAADTSGLLGSLATGSTAGARPSASQVMPAPTPTPGTWDGPERRAEGTDVLPRMGREDFDAYERSLRRRGVAFWIALPLVLVGLGAGVFAYLRWNRARPHLVEVEPNNDLEHATLIAAGNAVAGKIGQRLDDVTSDRDYYRVDLGDGPAPRKVSVELSPIRNIDLAVTLHDQTGKLLALGDADGVGGAEAIPTVSVHGRELFVAVLESREGPGDRGPTENITDEYRLTVSAGAFGPDEEIEPNDADSDATRLPPDRPVRGTLGRLHDVDRFRFEGAPGRYEILVEGAVAVPLRVVAPGGAGQTARRVEVELGLGSTFAIVRDDPPARPGVRATAAGVTDVYTVVVRPLAARAP